MKRLKTARLALIAGMASLVFGIGSLDASAQERANKGGEIRGQDRAAQVKEANELRKNKKEEKDEKEKKDEKSKKDKKEKKHKKEKREKK